MYQTMHRQPEDLARLLSEGWSAAEEAAQRLSTARRVLVVGIGTSYHAAVAGGWLLRAAGCDARAVSSFDFSVYPESFVVTAEDAVIIMAHSGVKTYSSLALERAAEVGATRMSVGSLTAEHAGSQQVLRTVERETSAAFTASHLAAMTVLAQVATALGESRNAPATRGFRASLQALPGQVREALAREDEVRAIAEEIANKRIYATGGGPSEASAIEAVIKVREAAQGWIDGLALEQFLHGPLVAVNADDACLVVHVEGAASERTQEVARVLDAIGARMWVIGKPIERLQTFDLPFLPEVLSPLLTVVPLQMLAYHMAVLRGKNPDRFRRDDPHYAAALGRLKL
jgi:glucosamine--fructose-6-phosphate aminotransferase (isomerizing)